jgi:hypothetical protein
MGIKKTKGSRAALAKQLIAGVGKRLANKTQVEFMGSSFTPVEITTSLQKFVDLRADVDAAKATATAKVAAESAELPALNAFMSALIAYIKVAYGASPQALADFGIQPKKRAPLTVEAKTVQVAKAVATRKARHTMGPRQKKGIHGAVTGDAVTPIVATPIAATPETPAAPAPAGAHPASGVVPRVA